MSIFTLLEVLFVALKLLKLIDWSWWLVLIPIYVEILLIIFSVILGIIKNKKEDELLETIKNKIKKERGDNNGV